MWNISKNKIKIQKLEKSGDRNKYIYIYIYIYIYKNELDKAYFQHDVKGTASDRVLKDKAFNIAKYPKQMFL